MISLLILTLRKSTHTQILSRRLCLLLCLLSVCILLMRLFLLFLYIQQELRLYIFLIDSSHSNFIYKCCYENGNVITKMINKRSKNKNNELVYMINKKYSKHISVKKGFRSKQETTKCSIKKADKPINGQQQHCKQLVYIYIDFAKAKTFHFKCIHQTACHAIQMTRQSKQRQIR